jgi:hypothetical protein
LIRGDHNRKRPGTVLLPEVQVAAVYVQIAHYDLDALRLPACPEILRVDLVAKSTNI